MKDIKDFIKSGSFWLLLSLGSLSAVEGMPFSKQKPNQSVRFNMVRKGCAQQPKSQFRLQGAASQKADEKERIPVGLNGANGRPKAANLIQEAEDDIGENKDTGEKRKPVIPVLEQKCSTSTVPTEVRNENLALPGKVTEENKREVENGVPQEDPLFPVIERSIQKDSEEVIENAEKITPESCNEKLVNNSGGDQSASCEVELREDSCLSGADYSQSEEMPKDNTSERDNQSGDKEEEEKGEEKSSGQNEKLLVDDQSEAALKHAKQSKPEVAMGKVSSKKKKAANNSNAERDTSDQPADNRKEVQEKLEKGRQMIELITTYNSLSGGETVSLDEFISVIKGFPGLVESISLSRGKIGRTFNQFTSPKASGLEKAFICIPEGERSKVIDVMKNIKEEIQVARDLLFKETKKGTLMRIKILERFQALLEKILGGEEDSIATDNS